MRNTSIIRYLTSLILLVASCTWAHAQSDHQNGNENEFGNYHYEHAYVQVCSAQASYEWHNKTYSKSGVYYDTLPAQSLGDMETIWVLNLQFRDTIHITKRFEIVRGTTIKYRGKEYKKEGIYTDTTHATIDCDTIFHIVIGWNDAFHLYDTLHLCESDLPYIWNNQTLKISGDYKAEFSTLEYDSIVHLHLLVHQPLVRTIHRTLCKNESIVLGPHIITSAGTYTHSAQNEYGCIDETTLIVTMADLAYSKQVVTFCESEGIRHGNGPLFKEHCTYFDTLPRAQQCDSVVETEYIPLTSFLQETLATRYEGETYHWAYDNKDYTKDSVYRYVFTAANGCDSIYMLRLSTMYEVPVTIYACQGDTMLYKGKRITDKTAFPIRDTLKTIYGGDSILLVTYQFYPRYYFLEHTAICAGNQVEWPGHTDLNGQPIILTQSGSYFDRKKTIHGCDSIYEIQVTSYSPYVFDTTIVVCNDSLLDFRWKDAHGVYHPWGIANVDTTITEILGNTPSIPMDNYYDTDGWHRALSGGCYSIWKMRLVAKDCGNDTLPICPESSIWVNGKEYKAPGDYTQHFVTSLDINAVDSICRYHIYPADPVDEGIYDTVRICASDAPYVWHNRRYNKTGAYTKKLQTHEGCDSLVHLYLHIYPTYLHSEATYNICRSDSLWIHNQRITANGTYYDTLYTRNGCDSVIRYTVNIVRDYFFEQTAHFQTGSRYLWHQNGTTRWLDQPGVYYDSCRTQANGCDSIYRLTLFEDYPSYHLDRDIHLCYGQTFQLNNQTITQSGIYTDRQYTQHGEDSIIRYIVNFHVPFYRRDTMLLPDGTTITWHGQTLTQPGLYHDSLTTLSGCDSIYQLLLIADYPTYHLEHHLTRCHNEPFFFNGQAITQSGTYTDSLTTQHGRDSIISYYVNFLPTFYMEQEAHFASGGSYKWVGHDTILTQPGIYTDSLVSSVTGCDSIYRLYLIEDSLMLYYDTVHICQNETPYLWHGYALYASTDTIKVTFAKNGSRTIYHLHLTVQPIQERTVHIDRCSGESFQIGNLYINSSCRFNDTLFTINGCDSIVHYVVNFHPSYFQRDTIFFHKGTTIHWHGKTLTIAGTYDDTIPTQFGCDSIYHLLLIETKQYVKHDTILCCASELPYKWHTETLHKAGDYSLVQDDSLFYVHFEVAPSYLFETTDYIYCKGATYAWFGRALTQTGVTYEERFQTAQGCDSIYRLTLQRKEQLFTPVPISICHNETLHIADTVVSGSCRFTRVYPSIQGCDSTVLYIITQLPSLKKSYSDSFCENDVYVWHRRPPFGDTILTQPGTYRYSFPIEIGCDSIYELRLTATKVPTWDTIIYFCADEPVTHGGHIYTNSTTITERFVSASGCDSLHNYHYRLIPYCSPWIRHQHCPGSSYFMNGYSYDQDGRYRVMLNADTLIRFDVASFPSYEYNRNIGVHCDSVQYGGTTYYARGNNQATFTIDRYMRTKGHDCDSIEHVTMTIYQSAINIPRAVTIDDYSAVLFGGQYYRESGQYVRNYHTIHGCDSTIRLDLTVLPTSHPGALPVFYCQGASDDVRIFGSSYRPTRDTMIIDTSRVSNTDLLIVSTAQVTVEPSFKIQHCALDSDVCADKNIPLALSYQSTGGHPAHYDLQFMNNDLGIIPPRQSGEISATTPVGIQLGGQGQCVQPGYYPYRLTLLGDQCHLSDTTFSGTILVRYPASTLEANWDNVVALLNEQYNKGSWEFEPPYMWEVKGSNGEIKTALVAPGNPNQPYLASNYLKDGDQVVALLKRKGYDATIPTCVYTFYAVRTKQLSNTLVSPSLVRKSAGMTIQSNQQGRYRIIDHTGEIYQTGTYQAGEHALHAPAATGCYLMQMINTDASQFTQKIIVY